MFGVVPKVLWSKVAEADDQNRVRLRINPLLIQLDGKNVLVETGMWDRGGEKFESMFALERDETVFSGLRAMGLEPSDIDLVINTHLHFDHAGRNVDAQGKPTFARASYLVQAQELYDAYHAHERSRGSYYVDEYIEPVERAGLFERVEGEAEILPGLRVLPAPGHNLGQQAVILESEGQTLVYTADLLPSFAHAPYPYVMGYDLYPVTCLEKRKELFPRWAEAAAVIAPPHDPRHAFGRFEPNPKGGYRLRALPR